MRSFSIEGFSSFVASITASIATGWSEPVPGRDLHPLKSSTFSRRTFRFRNRLQIFVVISKLPLFSLHHSESPTQRGRATLPARPRYPDTTQMRFISAAIKKNARIAPERSCSLFTADTFD
jgi:hypothetical protein